MNHEGDIIESIQDYMRNDGVRATEQSGSIHGWATLHLLYTLYEDNQITETDVSLIIREAVQLFGDCPDSTTRQQLFERFPDAFGTV